jgi:hypothetical protein
MQLVRLKDAGLNQLDKFIQSIPSCRAGQVIWTISTMNAIPDILGGDCLPAFGESGDHSGIAINSPE